MLKVTGRFCSFSRRWMQPVRTVRSNMSCLASIRRQVFSFKKPLSEDISHDFLCPSGGGSEYQPFYYEEVLIVRVHEEILQRQKLPPKLIGKHIFDERFVRHRAFRRVSYSPGNDST
jgi:hypothetical protein